MKKYQIYIYGIRKTDTYCRIIFLIDDEDQEQFVRAETKRNAISTQFSMGHDEAINFVNDNKLKLIDLFTTKL